MQSPVNNQVLPAQHGVGTVEEVASAQAQVQAAEAAVKALAEKSNSTAESETGKVSEIDSTTRSRSSALEVDTASADDLERVLDAADDLNLFGGEHVDFSAFRGRSTLIT